jgi:small redox-active disulfide protein 2
VTIIQILGVGCARCAKLFENAREAVRESGVEATVQKVSDLDEILAFGVIALPALVINGTVRVSGRVPSPLEIQKLLDDERN